MDAVVHTRSSVETSLDLLETAALCAGCFTWRADAATMQVIIQETLILLEVRKLHLLMWLSNDLLKGLLKRSVNFTWPCPKEGMNQAVCYNYSVCLAAAVLSCFCSKHNHVALALPADCCQVCSWWELVCSVLKSQTTVFFI